jgi:hypothetical protein
MNDSDNIIVWVDIQCNNCDDFFSTYQTIHDGYISEYCCSQDCYNKYHSKENIRERKLNKLLNEV